MGALNELVPLLYERMRQLAHQRLRSEAGASLNTTGLVHEMYLKLVEGPPVGVHDHGHFLALAARVMRILMVDHARARQALKRGAGMTAVEFEDAVWVTDGVADAVTDLDEALVRLKALDPRQSQLLEQRYYGGLSLEETAIASGISLATVKRELRSARAWLARELERDLA